MRIAYTIIPHSVSEAVHGPGQLRHVRVLRKDLEMHLPAAVRHELTYVVGYSSMRHVGVLRRDLEMHLAAAARHDIVQSCIAV
jgi:hypothetical protein